MSEVGCNLVCTNYTLYSNTVVVNLFEPNGRTRIMIILPLEIFPLLSTLTNDYINQAVITSLLKNM